MASTLWLRSPKIVIHFFFNYTKDFSVVLQVLVNADYKFVTVDEGVYDKNNGGTIFTDSQLRNVYTIMK